MKPPRTVVWLACAMLALSYLLPNHAPPWLSFWQQVLAATSLALLAGATLVGRQTDRAWRWPDLALIGLVLIPPVQYLSGLIPFVQTAWMNSLYLLGLLVALRTGSATESCRPAQILWVLLGAVWLAAMASVAMQWVQWLRLQPDESLLWLYNGSVGRPAANLGQPNSLASVIVLALLATYAAWRRRLLGASMALAVAGYLLFGLAMTQSRTGLLNAFLLGVALFAWQRRRLGTGFGFALASLAIFLLGSFVGYGMFGALFGLGSEQVLGELRSNVGSRPMAWRLAVQGILQHPVVGHGWGRSFVAQLDGALALPPLHEVFLSAHNLLLDLALWNGLPIALALAAGLAGWLWSCVLRLLQTRDESALLLLLFIGVLLVHAMLEHPLTYAYFLLPAGLAAGALNQRIGFKAVWQAPAWLGAALAATVTLAFALTLRDYLRVEQSYRDLLLEKARIVSPEPGTLPDVLVLDSLRELIVLSRIVPHAGMPAADLSWMRDVVSTHPGPGGFETLAAALALNGQTEEAQIWVDKLCSIFITAQCAAMAERWSLAAQLHAQMLLVRWPVK